MSNAKGLLYIALQTLNNFVVTENGVIFYTAVEKLLPRSLILKEFGDVSVQSCLLKCRRASKCYEAARREKSCVFLKNVTNKYADANFVKFTVLVEESIKHVKQKRKKSSLLNVLVIFHRVTD